MFDRSSPPLGQGPESSVVIRSVEVRLLQLPMVEQLAADHSTTTFRQLAVVGLGWEIQGSTEKWSWGECAALPERGYTTQSAQDCYQIIEDLAPDLLGGGLSDMLIASRIQKLATRISPVTEATFEMAALDAIGKIRNQSLAAMFGVDQDTVPAGATIGLGPIGEVAASVHRLADAGYRRIKVKIQPDHDLEVLTKLFDTTSDVEWHVDANGSYHRDDVELMVRLADLGVSAIEQPFAVDDEESAIALRTELARRHLHCLVVADESAGDTGAISRLAERGAASAITIKPFRFGGLAPAFAAIELCHQLGLATSVGGMIESALGRRSLAPLAGHKNIGLTGDLSPSRRWLAQDPWPDLETVVDQQQSGLLVRMPSEPGVAPPPDQELLDAMTVKRQIVG